MGRGKAPETEGLSGDPAEVAQKTRNLLGQFLPRGLPEAGHRGVN